MRPPPPRPPAWIALPGAVGVLFIALPLAGLLARAPWSRAVELLTSGAVLDALRLSLLTSTAAAAVSIILGVPVAVLLAHAELPGRRAMRALATLSMVLPPVVGGVALFAAFGRSGLVGGLIDRLFGAGIPFTPLAVVMAQSFVALPFLILTVEGALRSLDPRFVEAARSLGARPGYVLRRVTLPSIRPALVAGTVLAWARALGEFGATITFAGNLPGTTQTLPLAVYLSLQTDPGAAILVSLVLVATSFLVLYSLRDRWLVP